MIEFIRAVHLITSIICAIMLIVSSHENKRLAKQNIKLRDMVFRVCTDNEKLKNQLSECCGVEEKQ